MEDAPASARGRRFVADVAGVVDVGHQYSMHQNHSDDDDDEAAALQELFDVQGFAGLDLSGILRAGPSLDVSSALNVVPWRQKWTPWDGDWIDGPPSVSLPTAIIAEHGGAERGTNSTLDDVKPQSARGRVVGASSTAHEVLMPTLDEILGLSRASGPLARRQRGVRSARSGTRLGGSFFGRKLRASPRAQMPLPFPRHRQFEETI